MKEYITGAQYCEMILCACDGLEAKKQPINELNVFPVPDGDTGTNMSLTMSAAGTELRKRKFERIDEASDKTASALLRGARGNSGVILSLLFRGIAKGLKGCEHANAVEFAGAMCEGVDAAYKAVMKPAEGTILTVSRVASKAAMEAALINEDVEAVLAEAIAAGKIALDETMNQNPVLQRAGVVDAGGMGYLTILEAMLASLRGEMVASADGAVSTAKNDHADFSVFETGEIEFAYDTVFIVRKTKDAKPLDLYRAYLDSIGDSLVISEDDEIFKVHVHTNIPGEALTEAAKYGELELAKIENMRTQHDELVNEGAVTTNTDNIDDDHDAEETVAAPEKKYGFVSVCSGEGMANLFRELGADRIVEGGQTLNPSTEDILREVNATPAEIVYVFPNNKNIIMAAEQCIGLSEKKVVVVPTKTMPQGITAMLNLDTYAEEEELTAALNEAIKNVHTAQITYAARDSDIDGRDIKEGEFLSLLDGAL
ncbi:MAG: DAK2 domain-containing protein, partial [Oscillospiraceae bacterium]|nr:DAK2 domain-containing protein [Oscillospiraceae bacterium]